MSRNKPIKLFEISDRKAKIYYDSEWEEYTVSFCTGSDSWFRDDYYTTDYEDAIGTALYFCENQ